MPSSVPPRPRWWREPVVHFLLLGGALLALDRAAPSAEADQLAPETIVVSGDFVRRVEAEFGESGRPAAPDDVQRAIDDFVDEEILVREARRLGLDRGDLIIRRRLAQKMAFLIDDLAAIEPPTEADLAARLAAEPERYRLPARIDLEHVYFARERRGAAAEADARSALATGGADGDPFLAGRTLSGRTPTQLGRTFGKPFAAAVEALIAAPVDPERWHGPIPSTYGWHLIRVAAVEPARAPTLDEVRVRLRADELDTRERKASGQARSRLRDRYVVRLDGAAP